MSASNMSSYYSNVAYSCFHSYIVNFCSNCTSLYKEVNTIMKMTVGKRSPTVTLA